MGMKIRRFSESSESEIDIEYIRQCFADLIDSGEAVVTEREKNPSSMADCKKWASVSVSQFEINRIISPTKESVSGNNTLKRYIDTHNKNNDRLEEVGRALERIADEYPGYKISVEMFTSLFINIFP
jgi:hypothetical protein